MKFLALLKKEFRECLPWTVSAAVFLLILGSLMLWPEPEFRRDYRYPVFEQYSGINYYDLMQYPVSKIGGLVFMFAAGLGLALGIRQFWAENSMGLLVFTLHRSTTRTTILAAKICAGFISIIACIGLMWCYLFWRANLPDYTLSPLTEQIFIEGWFMVGVGLMFYLGTGLSGLSRARWYTTKLMGLGFAVWMLVNLVEQSFFSGFITLLISVVILLYLMWESFLSREF